MIVIKVSHWFKVFDIFIFSYFHFILLMYLTFVLYIPVDDHFFWPKFTRVHCMHNIYLAQHSCVHCLDMLLCV
jgi:hypothetical protein